MESGNIDFSLNLENIKSIPFDKYEKDFTFIVNGKRYPTTRYIADILSPIIRKYHHMDKSLTEFTINSTNLTADEPDYFDDFLSLSTFEKSSIDINRQKRFSEYFYRLGNLNEFFNVQPFYSSSITPENVVNLLLSTSELAVGLGLSESPIDAMISYAASNFEMIEKASMKELKSEVIEKIISSECLRLSDEDSLFRFVLFLYETDHSNFRLFEYIIFANVSLEAFMSFIDKFDVEYMSDKIWMSIVSRFMPSFKVNDQNKLKLKLRYLYKIKEFSHQNRNELRGIMRYLTAETGRNIHDNGTIEITSNSIREKCHPKNLVDFNKTNNYDSNDEGGAIVCFDFKDKLVQLSSYSIRSNDNGPNGCHLKNWVIEVSCDAKEWTEIDAHHDDPTLNGPHITATFEVKKYDMEFYRYVRLRQTGNSWYGFCNHNRFWLYSMEFYGKLKEPTFLDASESSS